MNLAEMTTEGRFAEARFSGHVERTSVLQCFRDVHKRCVATGVEAALIDLTETTGTLDSIDRIDLARILAAEWTRGIALAVVVNEAQHMPERPAQLAAQNRGMRTREFTGRNAAIAWIKTVLA